MSTFSSHVPATEEWFEGEQEMLMSLIAALDSGNTARAAICLYTILIFLRGRQV
jgi:hypothetical protein